MADKMPNTLDEFFRQLFLATVDITEAQSRKTPVYVVGNERVQNPVIITMRDGALVIEVLK